MATEAWIEYGGVELINHSRTAQLAQAMGISGVRLRVASFAWLQQALDGVDYNDVREAPWYDPNIPASAEFAGIICLNIDGLDASAAEATSVEYINDGGNPGAVRNATLPLVASVVLMALTERGVEYGYRWMNKVLKGQPGVGLCSGEELRFFRYRSAESPIVHYRNVGLTRGSSVTRKRTHHCSASVAVTFTLTAGDSYEYGEIGQVLVGLGSEGPSESGSGPLGFGQSGFGQSDFGGEITSSGSLVLTELDCPTYDYTPVFDPLYPALVPAPTVPDITPDGWNIVTGATFERYWAKVSLEGSSLLSMVPYIRFSSDTDIRMVRASIFPGTDEVDAQCDPLFTVIASYIPADLDLYVDGEQKAAYVWDGESPVVRRADTLVFGSGATPVSWDSFNTSDEILVVLDVFNDGSDAPDPGAVLVDLSLIPKSD